MASPMDLYMCAITVFTYLGEDIYIHRPKAKADFQTGCPVNIERDVSFLLYTRENPLIPDRLFLYDDSALLASHLNGYNPTVVFVHGFAETAVGMSGQTIKNAYLQRGCYNVILVDWCKLSSNPWYSEAVHNAHVVGTHLAKFLDYLDTRGIPLRHSHVIGFSLGAEVAGFTGQHLRDHTGPRLNRITGLDPAYPQFNYENTILHLSQDDAMFVDVIHTDGGIFGFPNQIGHVDFYPNGGKQPQPGCDAASILIRKSYEDLTFCSHRRSWKYFAESLNNELGFPAARCESWGDFLGGKKCSRRIAFMGIAANGTRVPWSVFPEDESEPAVRQREDMSRVVLHKLYLTSE